MNELLNLNGWLLRSKRNGCSNIHYDLNLPQCVPRSYEINVNTWQAGSDKIPVSHGPPCVKIPSNAIHEMPLERWKLITHAHNDAINYDINIRAHWQLVVTNVIQNFVERFLQQASAHCELIFFIYFNHPLSCLCIYPFHELCERNTANSKVWDFQLL